MATWAHPSRWVLPLTNVNRSGSSYFGRDQNMRHILLAKQHTYLPLVGYSKLAIEKALKKSDGEQLYLSYIKTYHTNGNNTYNKINKL